MDSTESIRPVKLIITVILTRADEVLLVKYKSFIDGQDGWILPTSTLEHEVDPNDAAKNLLLDQLGTAPRDLRISHVESFVGRDGTWHVPMHFVASTDGEVHENTQVSELKWFSRDALPPADQQSHHGWSGDVIKVAILNGF